MDGEDGPAYAENLEPSCNVHHCSAASVSCFLFLITFCGLLLFPLLWTSCLKFVNESTVPKSRVDVGYPPPQGALAMTLRCWRGFQMTAVLFLLLSSTAFAGNPQWVEVRSPHFSVITDAGEKRGREVAVRFEQMRIAFGKLLTKATVNLPVPLQIIAFRNAK